jgi:hypothetical protein
MELKSSPTQLFSVLIEVLSTKPTAEKKMDALRLSSWTDIIADR